MIEVIPQARITLQHRAYHVAPSDDGCVAILPSNFGTGTLLAPDLTPISSFSIPKRPSQVALSPDGTLLAVTASDGITFYSTSTFEQQQYMNGAYQSCLFGLDGVFWASSRFTPLTAALEAWRLASKTRTANVKLADPFGDSTFLLFPHPLPNSVVVWAAAGQDGQALFWASLDGETIEVAPFDQRDFTVPPAFSPSGKEFLITAEGSLYRYAYPNGPLLAQMNHLAEDDDAGDNICYLDNRHAFVTSVEGRLFVVDVVGMSVRDEVNLVGNDLRLVCYLVRLADGRFLSVHRDVDKSRARDCVAIWTAPLAKFPY